MKSAHDLRESLSRIKAVIFDMDGLMIDSERLYIESEEDMARKRSRVLTEDTIARMMGHKPIESMTIFKKDLGLEESAEALLAERDEMMRAKFKNDLVSMPGLFDLLSHIDGRCRAAIATGAPREFLDLTLDGLKIRDRFEVLVSADEVRRGKPDPEIYELAVKRLGLSADECLVLEDSSNGVRSAHAAGCFTIAVPSSYTKHQDFSLARGICASLSEVLELLR